MSFDPLIDLNLNRTPKQPLRNEGRAVPAKRGELSPSNEIQPGYEISISEPVIPESSQLKGFLNSASLQFLLSLESNKK